MSDKQLEWVVCTGGSGRLHTATGVDRRTSSFPPNSVGYIERQDSDGTAVVCLARNQQTWSIPQSSVKPLDMSKTGDKYPKKICKDCLRLLPTKRMFARNQSNKGNPILRRPSCRQCRTDIDKRAPKSAQAKKMEKIRPRKDTLYMCPVCRMWKIVGVTAKIVADHNHHTGDIRDFICDSCNTGLGRFKDSPDVMRNAIHYLEERDKFHVVN